MVFVCPFHLMKCPLLMAIFVPGFFLLCQRCPSSHKITIRYSNLLRTRLCFPEKCVYAASCGGGALLVVVAG